MSSPSHPRKVVLLATVLVGGGVLLIALQLLESRVQAAEQVSVHVKSGRTFQAWVDPKTDEKHLWLRTSELGITIRRPVQWDRVVNVDAGTRTLTSDEFRADVNAWKTAAPEPVSAAPFAAPPPMPAELAPDASRADLPLPIVPPNPRSTIQQTSYVAPIQNYDPADSGIPTSIRMDATLASWNGSVDQSGLLLSVVAIDNYGQVVPVSGTLTVELIGVGPGTLASSPGFVQVGNWTRQVTPDDLGVYGNVYRLEFQALHPEFDIGLGPHGLVHARLTVPGAGTFDASQSPTRIRPYDSIRDRLQQSQYYRFFANERTSRGIRAYSAERAR